MQGVMCEQDLLCKKRLQNNLQFTKLYLPLHKQKARKIWNQ